MAAKRPEGVLAREAPTSSLVTGAAVEATPSVAFGGISPTRGEIVSATDPPPWAR
jgi:hypothetical protein